MTKIKNKLQVINLYIFNATYFQLMGGSGGLFHSNCPIQLYRLLWIYCVQFLCAMSVYTR